MTEKSDETELELKKLYTDYFLKPKQTRHDYQARILTFSERIKDPGYKSYTPKSSDSLTLDERKNLSAQAAALRLTPEQKLMLQSNQQALNVSIQHDTARIGYTHSKLMTL